MKILFHVAFGIHLLSVLGILGLLLAQVKKSPRTISAGILHAGWTALVAALVMIGTWSSAQGDEPLNHTKFGVKGLVLAVVLTLGYKNVKKPAVANAVWAAMLGLVLLNIVLAYAWK